MVSIAYPHLVKYFAMIKFGDQVEDSSGKVGHHLIKPILNQFRFGLSSDKTSFIGQMPGFFLSLAIIGPFEGRTVVRMESKHSLWQISISVPDKFFLADPA